MAVADLSQARQRLALLEGENQLLRQRIAAAREQVEQLRTRLHFIEDRGTDAA
jgi:predicted nuclease with TOPRIM domain